MRLVTCTLAAVLLSGCSWLGGGHGGGSYGGGSGAYGVGCMPGGQAGYGQSSYGYGSGGAGCVGGGYGVAGGADGFGAGGFGPGGMGTGYGAGGMGPGGLGYGAGSYGQGGGAYGAGGYGAAGMGAGAYGAGGYGAGGMGLGGAGYGAGGMYGQGVGAGLAANGVGGQYAGLNGAGFGGAYGAPGGVTTLGSGATYGSAYGQNVVGTQLANGQFVNGAAVQTVQGAPIYVPQPYPAYYGVSQQLRGGYNYGGGAMPFGVELGGGTDFGIGGDLFTAKPQGPADGNTASNLQVSEIDAISYNDAFGQSKSIGGTLAYDANRNTTLIGSLGYSHANGQTVDDYATVQGGTYDAAGNFTPGATGPRALDASFSDLKQFTIEGGVRQYVGANPTFRPYVGAQAGFVHNNDVDFTQTFADGDATPTGSTTYNEQQYIQSGWNPTAAAILGAEMAVGPRAAIGVESGIRWSDSMDTNLESEDRWSIPVKLRGRVAF